MKSSRSRSEFCSTEATACCRTQSSIARRMRLWLWSDRRMKAASTKTTALRKIVKPGSYASNKSGTRPTRARHGLRWLCPLALVRHNLVDYTPPRLWQVVGESLAEGSLNVHPYAFTAFADCPAHSHDANCLIVLSIITRWSAGHPMGAAIWN